jgi:hypothetical protein
MDTLVIWGDAGHRARSEGLATAYNTVAWSVKDKPQKVKNLERLVFWGHGDRFRFCGLDPAGFVEFVRDWKKKNSKLTYVEMLTCNVRHRQTFADSFCERVVTLLSRKESEIRFKALPVLTTKSGKTCEFSILKWQPATATWAYVGGSGDNDDMMNGAANLLEYLMPPNGTCVGYLQAHVAFEAFRKAPHKTITLTDPVAKALKFNVPAQVEQYNKNTRLARDAAIYSGKMSSLRWYLQDIR